MGGGSERMGGEGCPTRTNGYAQVPLSAAACAAMYAVRLCAVACCALCRAQAETLATPNPCCVPGVLGPSSRVHCVRAGLARGCAHACTHHALEGEVLQGGRVLRGEADGVQAGAIYR